MRVLILGGTGFIGPHYVRAAHKRGHSVAVFNRGKGAADFPQTIERLVGDRNGNLEAIQNRDWDAVIDLAAYVPSSVRSLGEALKHRVKHYTLISTIAVYDDPAADEETREDSPLVEYQKSTDPYAVSAPKDRGEYGALKVLCEREAERHFPGRTLVLRPGYIVGPGDPQGFLAYWPARMEHGGEILAAGDPSMPVQFIDVRDLAEWSIRMIEDSVTGTYTATGPSVRTPLGQLIDAARALTSASATLTWAPFAWLAEQKDRKTWSKVLFWSLDPEGWGGAMRMNIEPALSHGLTLRPLHVTLADTFEEYKKQPADPLITHWPIYLECEKALLAAWQAQRTVMEDSP